jgi:hypothetical protein
LRFLNIVVAQNDIAGKAVPRNLPDRSLITIGGTSDYPFLKTDIMEDIVIG